MQKFFLVISFFLIPITLIAQTDDIEGKLKAQEEQKKIEEEANKKTDTLTTEYYKIYYTDGRIKTVDTSLSITKDYKFNFIRKDNFELIKMSNVGHTYNNLGYNFSHYDYPKMGALGKHFNYFEKDDIGYYEVPTPFTELFAKSTFEQGQILDALISINFNPNYNLTLAHKGYKSLGKYLSTKSRGNQFRLSSIFNSNNGLTKVKLHFTSQNLFNDENGGLDPDSIYFFEQAPDYFVLDDSGNQIQNDDGTYEMIYYDGYLDRSRLGPNLFASGSLYSKRFFTDISRVILNKVEKNTSLIFGYQYTHEYKKLNYQESRGGRFFGEFFSPNLEDKSINDLSRFIFDENIFYIISNLNKLGTIHLNFKLINWKNTFEIASDLDLINSLSPDQSKVSINWKKNFKNFNMYFDFDNSLKNSYKSNNIELGIEGNFLKNFKFSVSGSQFERSPNFNFILFRSQYDSYNWYNPNMSDEKTSKVSLDISYKNYVNLSGEYNIIDNFTFFRESVNPLLGELDFSRRAIPNQSINEIKYYKVKLYSNIPIGKFSIINTAQYQKKDQVVELEELSAVNIPEWVTRNTIMYSSKLFNNSLYIQTGVTFNYFTKFWANYYNPLISEFVVQNYKEIGEFPRFDLFFNAKIQQTRVFIKVEHLNSSFSGYDFYSDPFTPYRDMSVRFGLVWNFFQ